MSVDRIKFQNIVESQLPDYVTDDFPLLGEFLKQYYISQEFESGTYDLIQNLDQYVKVEQLTNLTTSTVLGADLGYNTTTIPTDLTGNFTEGFPNTNGLIMIDDEIIYYEYRTEFNFEGCRRGFSGTTSYQGSNTPDELVFTETIANIHTKGATIKNLNVLFLQNFLAKLKAQVTPGFDERSLFPELDQENFIINSDSFYKAKGTEQSYEILFRALYGANVDVIRPSEFLLRPSDANYKVTSDIIVEKFLGDPMELKNKTLFQDSTGARGSVSNVRPVVYNDKTFYQISLDLGYQRDINLDGTVLSSFIPAQKTQVLNNVSVGATCIDVDSTVGFPPTARISTTDIDGQLVSTGYEGKNDNQFFNVPASPVVIKRGTALTIEDFAYAFKDRSVTQEKIQVKISSALKDLTFEDKNFSLKKGDNIEFKSIGIEKDTEKTRNWDYNFKAGWEVEKLVLLDANSKSYRITVDNPTILNLGNKIQIINSDEVAVDGEVASIIDATTFTVNLQVLIDLNNTYKVENQILYTNSTDYPYLKKYFTNVQNLYCKLNDDVLVASNSLPSYKNLLVNPYDRSVNFTGTATNNTIEFVSSGDHGFFTGDAVYYTPSEVVTTTTDSDGNQFITRTPSTFTGVTEGVYYIKRVSNLLVKLAKSRSNLFSDLYVKLEGSVQNVNFTYYPFYKKTFQPQSIYRSISTPVNKTGDYKTVSGYTGILNNGVEVLNYKSPNKLNYGKVREYDVVNRGKGYDIINPPIVQTSDEVGVGATGVANVRGGLERIEILDTGFDYQERPIVSISGGNGKNAAAEVRLSAVTHSVAFNAEQNTGQVSLGASTIGFSTFHKFRDGEEVIYQTFGQMAVGGLSTAASYHVGVINATTVKLYETFNDSIAGINTVALRFFGNGVQNLKSAELKNIVTSIIVTNPGTNYENKEKNVVGVNTALNRIVIEDHGYQSRETVRYTGTTIQGLAQNKDYYVKKIDDNSFSLTDVGTGTTTPDYYYNRDILIDLESTGSGSFNYKPIIVTVDGVTGVSTLAGQNFNCQVQPVFRGEIQSIDTTNGGVGYGSSEIINFDRRPVVTLFSGTGAILVPIINNGQIVDVLVNDKGRGYNSPPDLEILTTTGKNALLTPVLKNGQIESVTIIKGGAGYVADKTTILVTPSGREAVVEAAIDQWNINLFERNYPNIEEDDGILDNSISDTTLEYSYLYAPRPLRENTFAVSGTAKDNTRYGTPDLVINNGVEQTSVFHSPIIGWAYDGNPIYGPYGFDEASGSSFVKAMSSGYELRTNLDGRPPVSLYPVGFFIEDYIFTGEGDLDEHNGRFCVTPDYPNGVYAYFATINTINDSTGAFTGFRRPQFPYLIGDSFHSVPEPFNFRLTSNQNDYDVQSDNWLRDTFYYNLNEKPVGYQYIFNPNSVKDQRIEITSASLGEVENVGIITGGSNYQVNDPVIFNNQNSGGGGARAVVSSLDGKEINTVSVASTVFYDVEFTPFNTGRFTGFTNIPHSLTNDTIVNVSGLSSYFGGFDGSYQVGVRTDTFVLTLGISSAPSNQVEYLYVDGILEFPYIRSNDILSIREERVRVLNIDKKSGRIRVQRGVDGTVATAHTSTTVLFEDPKKFSINVGSLKTTRIFDINKTLYFDPAESVGLGTVNGTGLGSTITFSSPGVGVTQVFVPTQNLFLPGHGLKLNDPVVYSPNGGTTIQVWNGISSSYTNLSSYQNLFAVPLSVDTIGISSNKVGLGSTGYYVGVNTNTALFYYTTVGVGNTHRFTTNLTKVVTAEVSQNTVTVSTASTHGLTGGDRVTVNVKPDLTKTVVVQYDDYNRRIVFDPQSFVAGNVDVNKNSITFSGEFFKFGDKVIHTSSSPSGGLVNEGMYYVIPFNDTSVRLVAEEWELSQQNPTFVDITSASTGTLSRINPLVDIEKNSKLTFDLSDSSLSFVSGGTDYPAFDMNLYRDRGYSNVFFTTGLTDNFDVVKTGRPGVDANANLTLTVTDTVPTQLYYKFDTDVLDLIPRVKSELVIDEEVYGYNSINIIQSVYNGNYNVVGLGTTTFQYSISKQPQVSVFNSTNSFLEYTTSSKSAYGPISKIDVTEGGAGYKVLPGITSIRSGIGSNSLINLSSNSIGEILSTRFEDIGFNYASDQTIKVMVNVPEVLEVDALMSFDNIGVTSSGKNYLTNPTLVVIDGFTGDQVEPVDIRFNLGDTEVDILQNTNGLYDVTPTILPTNNSNGVGISSLVYTPSTQNVRVYLNSQFSEAGNFRYKTGARVMIEGISVGVGSTGRGYNSEDYNYALFEVTTFDMQLGGSGAYFDYSLDGYLLPGQVPGTVDPLNSAGRAIPQSDFPVFDITLKPNDFFIDEKVVSGTNIGIVERWTPTNGRLIISSSDEFEIGSKVIGESSGTEVVVKDRSNFNATVSTGAGTTFVNGWQTNSGFLNDNLQRLPNNEYYQNLSYSLKSEIPLETWDDAVSSLSHVAGLAKFADLMVESTEKIPGGIQVTAGGSDVEVVIDVISAASIWCFTDFDNVGENSFRINGNLTSDEIFFRNRKLTDYNESIGNRVLSIDDFSGEFQSGEDGGKSANVSEGGINGNVTYNKFVTYARDSVLTNKRQVNIVSVLHDETQAYISEYGNLETVEVLGSYDFAPNSDATKWFLEFDPIAFSFNSYDITSLSIGVLDNITSTGSTTFGTVVEIDSAHTTLTANQTKTIASIPTTNRSSKLLVQIENPSDEYTVTEMNLVHDGTDVYALEYGEIATSVGFGTFNTVINGSNVDVNFVSNVGVALTVNAAIINTSAAATGVGSIHLDTSLLSSAYTSIPSSGSPTANTIYSYTGATEAAYHIVTVTDTTNNEYESFEVITVQSEANSGNFDEFVEYANVTSAGSLGQVGIDTASGKLDLTYTPNASIATQVRVFSIGMEVQSDSGRPTEIDLNNVEIISTQGQFTASTANKRTAFGLKHKGQEIFQRGFDGGSATIVSTTNNSVTIPNHFFVSGEQVVYTSPGLGSTAAIGIAATNIPGVGVTDKLPTNVFVVAPNSKELQFAATAADALSLSPTVLDITSVGVGLGHTITARKQNQKVLVAVDNIIQSPVVSFGVTATLSNSVIFSENFTLSGVTSIFTGDNLRLGGPGGEIVTVKSVGISLGNAPASNDISVRRAMMGTLRQPHVAGTLVEKLSGEYNIVGNTLTFASPPNGAVPVAVGATVDPDSTDWTGITTGSTFQGRSFMRSGIPQSTEETYTKNYIFDNVSYQFTGIRSEFTMKVDNTNVTGVATMNPFVVINGIAQEPTGSQPPSIQVGDFRMSENTGVTSITFTGNDGLPTGYDPNNGAFPIGGLLVSLGSSEGSGYQPLISAGGTVTVSSTGTITAVSIANSGSGYRAGIQTVVNVGVQTYSTGIPNIEFIGTAAISGGHIVSVAITNPGVGYTGTDLPDLVFDAPLSYNDIPLEYAPGFVGSGQSATVNIVVGVGGSVIDFELQDPGFGYGNAQVLTIPVGGPAGIPTDPSLPFKDFQIDIEEVFNDRFNSWSVGDIEVLDTLDRKFNGVDNNFQLTLNGDPFSIATETGSPIETDQTLIIFINDVLQVPGSAYIFNGGSIIRFTEAPRPGDTSKILFYSGTSGVDVRFVDILETVKPGDLLDIDPNTRVGQGIAFDENPRTVTGIGTVDSVFTNPYQGPGITTDPNLLRPVTWCKQLVDKIINGEVVGKDRPLYEPQIYPASYLIQNVGTADTIGYINTVEPLFDAENEANPRVFQNRVTITSQNALVGASATAIVSTAGTVTSISITNAGIGYTLVPDVSISTPVGVGTTQRATATATISNGSVSGITVTSPGTGYTTSNPPQVLIETPDNTIETIPVNSYVGDYGVIVGFNTTKVGSQDKFIFDLFIPQDSYMRDISLVGTGVTVSQLIVGDYLTIFDTNINAGGSFETQNTSGSVVGIATTFSDAVYQVAAVSNQNLTVAGVGVTVVRRITTNVGSIGNVSFGSTASGQFSWGKVVFNTRVGLETFNAYTMNGYSGISTSGLLNRTVPLKSDNYV